MTENKRGCTAAEGLSDGDIPAVPHVGARRVDVMHDDEEVDLRRLVVDDSFAMVVSMLDEEKAASRPIDVSPEKAAPDDEADLRAIVLGNSLRMTF